MAAEGRRRFLIGAGALLAAPALARAQGRVRRVAWLGTAASGSSTSSPFFDAIREGLRERGWEEGRNLTLTPFWTQGTPADAEPVARQVVASNPEVILTAFGLLDAEDPMVVSTMAQVVEGLTVRSEIGGIARYTRDPFLRRTEDFARAPGNPWIPCTLWVAQHRIAAARTLDELRAAAEALVWTARHARPSGLLPEQLNPLDGEPVSVCPLSWSHAEFVITVWDYLDRRRQLASSVMV